jgi:hypothetical protein
MRKVGFIEGTRVDLDGQVRARGSGIAIPTPLRTLPTTS